MPTFRTRHILSRVCPGASLVPLGRVTSSTKAEFLVHAKLAAFVAEGDTAVAVGGTAAAVGSTTVAMDGARVAVGPVCSVGSNVGAAAVPRTVRAMAIGLLSRSAVLNARQSYECQESPS